MITVDDLQATSIERVIFHDVPRPPPGSSGSEEQLRLSEVETTLDTRRKALLKKKLVQVIGSTHAASIQFDSGSTSPAREIVKTLTESEVDATLGTVSLGVIERRRSHSDGEL